MAHGLDSEGEPLELILSPLAEVGGRPNEMGRVHPVGTQYFRVWVPAEKRA